MDYTQFELQEAVQEALKEEHGARLLRAQLSRSLHVEENQRNRYNQQPSSSSYSFPNQQHEYQTSQPVENDIETDVEMILTDEEGEATEDDEIRMEEDEDELDFERPSTDMQFVSKCATSIRLVPFVLPKVEAYSPFPGQRVLASYASLCEAAESLQVEDEVIGKAIVQSSSMALSCNWRRVRYQLQDMKKDKQGLADALLEDEMNCRVEAFTLSYPHSVIARYLNLQEASKLLQIEKTALYDMCFDNYSNHHCWIPARGSSSSQLRYSFVGKTQMNLGWRWASSWSNGNPIIPLNKEALEQARIKAEDEDARLVQMVIKDLTPSCNLHLREDVFMYTELLGQSFTQQRLMQKAQEALSNEVIEKAQEAVSKVMQQER